MAHAFLMRKTPTYMQSKEGSRRFLCRLEGFARYFQRVIHLSCANQWGHKFTLSAVQLVWF